MKLPDHLIKPLQEAVRIVFEQLEPQERAVLRFDAQNTSFHLLDDQRVLSPAYKGLVNPIGNLEQLLRDALVGRLSAERVQELQHMPHKAR